MKIIIFIYGLLFGSFFNVVGLRIPEKRSIIKPRSSCPNCGHVLTFLELIPVFSYLWQIGKCKHCHNKISVIYPIMEILTASLFVFAYIKLGWGMDLVIAWTLISLLVIISISDIKYMLIPDKILLFFFSILFIERLILPLNPWWDSLVGASVIFVILFMIAVISKGGMGGGDIKLFTVLGFVLGLKQILFTFFFANIFGALIGLIGMAIGVFERKKPIPFGPFIAIGTFITLFYYDPIIKWYLSLL